VGEPVRLILRTDDGEHCFAVDAFRVEKRIMPGRATELELVPDRTGRFPFYCCLETAAAAARERGEIVVTE
jgi:heme/copper-type cytochrome/quinol oxidase subunit 2